MTASVDLSKHFTQEDYSQFLQRRSRSIVPMFYEIRDRHTGELKGCLLGTNHALRTIQREFSDAPDIFGSNSKVQKCFHRAAIFAAEVFMPELWPYTSFGASFDWKAYKAQVDSRQSIDGAFELASLFSGKRWEGLTTPELHYNHICFFNHHMEQCTPLETDCSGLVKKGFKTGSEELLREHQKKCMPEILQRLNVARDRTMAMNLDSLLRTPEIVFAAIGASHLVGVCNELQIRRWDVQRVFEDHQQG